MGGEATDRPISFVVVTHRKGVLLAHTLAALSGQIEGHDEIIVVDDGGWDGEIVAGFPHVRYLPVEHEGYRLSLMCNLGIVSATHERIVKLDGDCVAQDGFVDSWRDCMEAEGVWGGRIDWQNADGSIQVDFRLDAATLAPLQWFLESTRHGEQIYGGNMAFFAADAIRVGGFYDGFHYSWGAEDGDFARKLYHIGRSATYNWSARVIHQFHPVTSPYERRHVNRELLDRRLAEKTIDPPLSLDVSDFAREEHRFDEGRATDATPDIQVVCINLSRRPDRMAVMDHQFHELGYSVRWLEAVDGRTLPEEAVRRWNETTRRPLRRGELGCTLSHMAAWREAWDAGWPYVWILEDDVRLGLPPEVLGRGVGELNEVEPDWDLLYVTDEMSTDAFYQVCDAVHIAPELDKSNPIPERHIGGPFSRVGPQLGAHSYVLSRTGLEKCIAGFETLLNPVDIQLGQLNGHLSTVIWRCPDVTLSHDGTSDTR